MEKIKSKSLRKLLIYMLILIVTFFTNEKNVYAATKVTLSTDPSGNIYPQVIEDDGFNGVFIKGTKVTYSGQWLDDNKDNFPGGSKNAILQEFGSIHVIATNTGYQYESQTNDEGEETGVTLVDANVVSGTSVVKIENNFLDLNTGEKYDVKYSLTQNNIVYIDAKNAHGGLWAHVSRSTDNGYLEITGIGGTEKDQGKTLTVDIKIEFYEHGTNTKVYKSGMVLYGFGDDYKSSYKEGNAISFITQYSNCDSIYCYNGGLKSTNPIQPNYNVKAVGGFTNKNTINAKMISSCTDTSHSTNKSRFQFRVKPYTVPTYTDKVNHYVTGFRDGDGTDGDKFLIQTSTRKSIKNLDVTFSKTLSSPWSNTDLSLTGLGSKFIQKDIFTYDYESGNQSYKTITQPGKNITASYYYDPKPYTITYVLDGGTNSPNNPSTYNVLYGVKLADPTKDGYKFLGWTEGSGLISTSNPVVYGINLDSDGNPLGASFSSLEDLNNKIKDRTASNKTFYAHWGYDVSVELDGGDSQSLYAFDRPYEVNRPVPLNGEKNSINTDGSTNSAGTSRAGFTLKGWRLSGLKSNGTSQKAALNSTMTSYLSTFSGENYEYTPNYNRASLPNSYYQNLATSNSKVYFETIWKDEMSPVLSLTYTNDMDSNTDIYPENAQNGKYNPGDWTSKSVTVQATAADGGSAGKAGGSGFAYLPWFDSDSQVKNSGYNIAYTGEQPVASNSKTFSDSTTTSGISGTIYAKDNAGTANTTKGSGQRRWWTTNDHTSSISYGTIKIDKVKPIASLTYTWFDITENDGAGKEVTKDVMDTYTNGNVTLTIKASDTLSGIKGKAFCRIEGDDTTNYAAKLKVASNWVPATSGTTFVTVVTKNETGRIYVRDAVGNYTYVSYNVNGIDRKNPYEDDFEGTDKSNESTIDWKNQNHEIKVTLKDQSDANNVASGLFMIRLYETTVDFPTVKKTLNAKEHDILDKSKCRLLNEDDGVVLKDLGGGVKELSYTETKEGMNFLVVEAIDKAGNVTNTYITIKIDKTFPGIPNGNLNADDLSDEVHNGNCNKGNFVSGEYWKIIPVDLGKVDADKIEEYIKNEDNMMTSFYFTMFDSNFSGSYAYSSNKNVDDSGFAKVTLELYDTDTITRDANGSIVPTVSSVGVSYMLYDYTDSSAATRTSRAASSGRIFKTAIDSSANTYEWDVRDKLLDTTYLTNQSYSSLSLKAKINTMADFPGASTLSYRIIIEDRAGNQKTLCNQEGNEIQNFAIRAVIHSGEDEKFDTDYEVKETVYDYNNHFASSEKTFTYNLPYFQLGDRGYVEVWTVGYVQKIQTNFGSADLVREGNISIGEEMIKEIKEGRIPAKYNLGTYAGSTDPNYYRLVDYTKGDKVNISYASDVSGVPYATHYGRKEAMNYALEKPEYDVGWLSDGVAIRMPIYYNLMELIGESGEVETNKDGTAKYASEMHQAAVYAWKSSVNNASAPLRKSESTALYVIWDTNSNDLHYRVTH